MIIKDTKSVCGFCREECEKVVSTSNNVNICFRCVKNARRLISDHSVYSHIKSLNR